MDIFTSFFSGAMSLSKEPFIDELKARYLNEGVVLSVKNSSTNRVVILFTKEFRILLM